MKKLFLFLAFAFVSMISAQSAQRIILDDAREKYSQKKEFSRPLILIDGKIASMKILQTSPDVIESVHVYKPDGNLPDFLKQFSDLTTNGIIDIRIKKGQNHFKSMTQAGLNRKFGLPETTALYFGNRKITSPAAEFLEGAEEEISVKEENGEKYLVMWPVQQKTSCIKL